MPAGAFFAPQIVGGMLVIGGILLGVVAVLLASLALGGIHHSGRSGVGFAVAGILFGLLGAGGSVGVLAMTAISQGPMAVNLENFELDADALNHMLPAVARAMRANALIETRIDGILGGIGIGSGVIMRIDGRSALILTNRHVVDPQFAANQWQAGKPGLPDGRLQIKLIDQPARSGASSGLRRTTLTWRWYASMPAAQRRGPPRGTATLN